MKGTIRDPYIDGWYKRIFNRTNEPHTNFRRDGKCEIAKHINKLTLYNVHVGTYISHSNKFVSKGDIQIVDDEYPTSYTIIVWENEENKKKITCGLLRFMFMVLLFDCALCA